MRARWCTTRRWSSRDVVSRSSTTAAAHGSSPQTPRRFAIGSGRSRVRPRPTGPWCECSSPRWSSVRRRYLGKTEPVATWLVTLRSDTLEPVAVALAPDPSAELYGWSVTSDRSHTYLYGHCYRQFGWSAFGHDPCAENVQVARVPLGELSTVPEYWNGVAWNSDRSTAAPVIDAATTGAGVNPAQVMWDGTSFLAIVKEGDWWGTDIVVASSAAPTGPFEVRTRIPQPLRCEPAICNTYFASWLPWRESPTTLTWSLSNNRWERRVLRRVPPDLPCRTGT